MVCAARRASDGGRRRPIPSRLPHPPLPGAAPAPPPGRLADELGATLACLLQRARSEPDPERCRTLMECVRIGWDLLR